MKTQHRLGQHYSKEEKLILPYTKILVEQINNIVVDPFVGEGHLLFFYLNLFDFETQKKIITEKKILGIDIYEENIINLKNKFKEFYNLEDSLLDELFKVEDSLLNNNLPEKTFILTNPPYLAKNVCKQKYPEDFKKYFLSIFKKENDYFEIAINQYKNYNGIWIVPANIISSDLMFNTRKTIVENLMKVYIYEEKTFEDTDITVTTFFLNKNIKNKEINIIFKHKDNEEEKIFQINKNKSIVDEWDNLKKIKNNNGIKHGYLNSKINKGDYKITVLDEKYKEKIINVSEEDFNLLNNNILILRTTDTGSSTGKIGLYTIEEIWNNKEAKGLITKISSRVYTQIFLNLTKEEQIKIKEEFNNKLNSLREKYNSVFLTNYKNSCNGKQRKRISFKDSFSLLNSLLNK